MHMGERIHELNKVAGDTSFRYSDLNNFISQMVQVRVTASTSTFLSIYVSTSFLERPPATVMDAMTLEEIYPLTFDSPYLTVMVVSSGGPTNYLLEYGRLDEMQYDMSSSSGKLLSLLGAIFGVSSLLISHSL